MFFDPGWPGLCWTVSALCWGVLCSVAGALSHALTETIWVHPARAWNKFPICQRPVTPEHRRSKRPAVPTTTQLLYMPASLSTPLLLLSAHVFLRLTTNPPFMCIIVSLALTGVTTLETLRHVVVAFDIAIQSSFCQCLVSVGLFAFLFVCFFTLAVKKRMRKRSWLMRRWLMQSLLAKP